MAVAWATAHKEITAVGDGPLTIVPNAERTATEAKRRFAAKYRMWKWSVTADTISIRSTTHLPKTVRNELTKYICHQCHCIMEVVQEGEWVRIKVLSASFDLP